jgi:hypothetical protein
MKTLKLLFGMAIATTLLFTACDKTDDAQCATEQYKKDIAGEWACYNPDYVVGEGTSYLHSAFLIYMPPYVTFKENGYYGLMSGSGWADHGDIHDTLIMISSTDWENYYSWSIKDDEITIEFSYTINTYKINFKTEDELELTWTEDGVDAGTQNFRRITEEDMVYVWTE